MRSRNLAIIFWILGSAFLLGACGSPRLGLNHSLRDVQEMADGHLIAIGHAQDLAHRQDDSGASYLLTLTASGKLVETVTVGDRSDFALDLLALPDGDRVVAGRKEYFGDRSFLARYDGQGTKLWTQVLDGSLAMHGGLQPAHGGGFALAGYRFEEDHHAYWLAVTDENGQKIWSRTYVRDPAAEQVQDWAHALLTTENGYLLLGRSLKRVDHVWLLKVDAKGEPVWEQEYGGSEDDWLHALIEAPDEGFLLVGSSYSYRGQSDDPPALWCVRIDAAGKMLWQESFAAETRDEVFSVIRHETGYLLAGSSRDYATQKVDALLIAMDDEGQMLWQKTYEEPADTAIERLHLGRDGNLWAAGHLGAYGQQNAWLMQVDFQGEVLSSETIAVDLPRDFAKTRAAWLSLLQQAIYFIFLPLFILHGIYCLILWPDMRRRQEKCLRWFGRILLFGAFAVAWYRVKRKPLRAGEGRGDGLYLGARHLMLPLGVSLFAYTLLFFLLDMLQQPTVDRGEYLFWLGFVLVLFMIPLWLLLLGILALIRLLRRSTHQRKKKERDSL